MADDDRTNGWRDHQKLVLKQLEDHGKFLRSLSKDMQQIKVDLAKMKIMWGFLSVLGGGGVAVVIRLIVP